MAGSSSDEWKEQAFARWLEQGRREMEQRADAGICTLYFETSDEEGGPMAREPQTQIADLHSALTKAQYSHRAPFLVMDSAEAVSGYTGEFLVATSVLTAFISAGGTALAAWFASRSGRKVRIKMGDEEAEARTIEELGRVLELMRSHRSRFNSEDDTT